MWNYRHTTIRKIIFSLFLLLISILFFFAILLNPKIHPNKEPNPLTIPFLLITQDIIYQIYLAIGPAIHIIYIVLFSWAIILWDSNYSFSFIQGLLGLLLLLVSYSVFSQAYCLFWDGKLDSGNSIGYRMVEEILVPHFGVLPSVVASFMLALAGLILSLDWLSIAFLRMIFLFLLYLCRLVKKVGFYIKHGFDWINTHVISLEQYTFVTEPPAVQLQLPLTNEKENYSSFQYPDTSYLPDFPVIDENKDSAETFLKTSSFSSVPKSEFVECKNKPTLNSATMEKTLPSNNIQEKKNRLWSFSKKETAKPTSTISTFQDGEPIRSGRPSQHRIENFQTPRLEVEYPEQYTKPPLTLLDEPVPYEIPNYNEQIQERAEILIKTLERFGVKARVTGITHGPTITRYELEPEPGIKVTRFLSHADDITLALKADRVRVEAPIPGKGKVGIEVPNPIREQVLLRELLESSALMKHRGRLRLPLGKDITGEVKVVDLTQMPHLLIAGATGSGKTVFVKALLASLLFQYTPDELRLVLIDPKMVEFSIFNDIPHLLEPVVTDAKKAGEALDILVKEMERRYTLFANTNTRNLEIYNQNVENGQLEIYEENSERDLFSTPIKVVRKLPHIVCIIDELADLMMLQRNAVESAIARLSQLARAVGIHLIVATQRPSVDVITGVIKANFPARISFQVSSKIDSRCILDTIGAEKLIGHGDMLYHNAGLPKPMRIQGAFVSDEEIEALVNYLKSQAPPQYLNSIGFDNSKKKENDFSLDDDDPLFDEAVRIVRETKQASVSLLQRRLRVGYARAGHLIDLMELRGIVGPHRGSKPREILNMAMDNNSENDEGNNYNNPCINPSDEEDNHYE